LHRYVPCKTLRRREYFESPSESWDGARARLIKTCCGTGINESLLPEARQECLGIPRSVSAAVDEEALRMVRGDKRHLKEGSLTSNPYQTTAEESSGEDAGALLCRALSAYLRYIEK